MVRPVQHGAGSGDTAALNAGSNCAARNAGAAPSYGIDLVGLETVRTAKLPQRPDVASGFVPKAEVVSDNHGARREFSGDNFFDELLRRELRRLGCEGKYFDVLDALGAEELDALLQRGQQARRAVRSDHARGMRVECEQRRRQTIPREFEHAMDQPLVADVGAVEVSYRERGIHA